MQQGVGPRDALPALRRLADSEDTRRVLDEPLFTAYTEALNRNSGGPVGDTTIQDWATWWFLEAIRGGQTRNLDATLRTAQDKAEAFTACLGPAGDQDMERIGTCVHQVDPNHPLAFLNEAQ